MFTDTLGCEYTLAETLDAVHEPLPLMAETWEVPLDYWEVLASLAHEAREGPRAVK